MKANQNMRTQKQESCVGRQKKENVDRRDGMKKENNLINCKKGMIMAKRVWAHKMATCGAKRDRERWREETVR